MKRCKSNIKDNSGFGETLVNNAKQYSENHSEEEYQNFLCRMSDEFANMFEEY